MPDDDPRMFELIKYHRPELYATLQEKFGEDLAAPIGDEHCSTLIRRYHHQLMRDYDRVDLQELRRKLGEESVKEFFSFLDTLIPAVNENITIEPHKTYTEDENKQILEAIENAGKGHSLGPAYYNKTKRILDDTWEKTVLAHVTQSDSVAKEELIEKLGREDLKELFFFTKVVSEKNFSHQNPPLRDTQEGREVIMRAAWNLQDDRAEFRPIYEKTKKVLAGEKEENSFEKALPVLVQNSFYIHNPRSKGDDADPEITRERNEAVHTIMALIGRPGEEGTITANDLLDQLAKHHPEEAAKILDDVGKNKTLFYSVRQLCCRILRDLEVPEIVQERMLITGENEKDTQADLATKTVYRG